MSTTEFLVILAAVGIIGMGVGMAAITGKLIWRGLLENALRRKGRSRWRLEEVRCDKCANSDKPGYRRYENFNPVTESLDVTLAWCDKCAGTGNLTIAVIPDDLRGEELKNTLNHMANEMVDTDFDPVMVKRESEVSEANE